MHVEFSQEKGTEVTEQFTRVPKLCLVTSTSRKELKCGNKKAEPAEGRQMVTIVKPPWRMDVQTVEAC